MCGYSVTKFLVKRKTKQNETTIAQKSFWFFIITYMSQNNKPLFFNF